MMIGRNFVMNGQPFHADVELVLLNYEAQEDDVVTCLWPIHAIGLKVVAVFYQFLAKMGSMSRRTEV